MDAVEDYARMWTKREVDQDPELESLSDWVRTIRSLVQGWIHKLKHCVNSRPKSVFKYPGKHKHWYIALTEIHSRNGKFYPCKGLEMSKKYLSPHT
jgi:hypothetical protein